MKIDLHTHILPRDRPDLDAKYGYRDRPARSLQTMLCADDDRRPRLSRDHRQRVGYRNSGIEEMDREKIAVQVFRPCPVMFSYWAKPHDALELSRRLNDHIAGVVRELPQNASPVWLRFRFRIRISRPRSWNVAFVSWVARGGDWHARGRKSALRTHRHFESR